MKKKLLAVVTAAVLALGCASSAFAAVSYDASVMADAFKTSKFGIANVTTTSGDYKVETAAITAANMEETGLVGKGQSVTEVPEGFKGGGVLEYVKARLFKDLKETAGVSAGKILAIFIANYKDIDEDNGTEICFYVDGIKKTDSIAMWHWDNKDLKWEQSSCQVTKVDYNHVWAKVKKLSPVAFVKGGAGATTGTGSTAAKDATKAATNAKAAPKTGEV